MQLIYVIQDKEVYVDGVNRQGDYTLPEGLKGEVHSIVWANTQKEYNTVVNGKMHCVPFMDDDYDSFIVPLSKQWEEFDRVANLSQVEKINEGIEECPMGTKL